MTTLVSCKQLKKSYGKGETEVVALRGVDLEVYSGELLMIVGPSGSGKTTLISVIAGVLDQDEGESLVFGADLRHMSDLDKTRYRGEHIGFVFQAFNLIPMFTTTENVAVPLLLNGVEQEEALQRAKEILISFGLEEKLDTHPPQLSTGQQQRVAIARGCIHNPGLVVCDEPTSALDHETGEKVLTLLRESVLQENRALVIVTHDVRIFPFADRIVRLEDGQIVSEERNHH